MVKHLWWVLVFCLLVACTNRNEKETTTLTIFAASSLTDAFENLAETYQTQHPNVEINLNFAASSVLATQIIEGAKPDIYASANEMQMERVQDEDLLVGAPQTFASNELVFITFAETGITTQEDLLRDDLAFVLAMPAVPIREYSDQVLQNYRDAEPPLPQIAEHVMAHLVSEEDNVRQLVLKVSLGEADAGMVYRSDVTADIQASLNIIAIPSDLNVMARYPIGALNDADLTQDFINFVLSAEGQAILQQWGFNAVH